MSKANNAYSLMIQGCTSDAGKSLMLTALARILVQHNCKVAPFKPQNMALNSLVTAEAGEIGRAQGVQAEAAGITPSVHMNPILLKPNSDIGAQVIVHGQSIGNMLAAEYHQHKPQLMNKVVESYQHLAERYELILIEGAGSPAEINLRQHDIANMGFAERVDCPVIIVADIDRGGVFAHLFGTYELLSNSEKSRVKGFVINKFRGDVDLLQDGLDWLYQRTGIKVLAVIPYIPNLHIESEDTANAQQYLESSQASLKLVVPLYPRASNHTDFDVLRAYPQVDCQLLKDSKDFKGADLIILPGSKNVRSDLAWLRKSGWLDIIQRHLRLGGKVIGICGGYQMLGQSIADPLGLEAAAGTSPGLGLLNITTELQTQKKLRNVQAKLVEQNVSIKGYEIHQGTSQGPDLDQPLFEIQTEEGAAYFDGAKNAEDTVLGTYIHGLFDEPEALTYFLNWAGLDKAQSFNYADFRQSEIDRLAAAVEAELPYAKLCELVGMKVKL